MIVLGISAYFHDSAASILNSGEIIAAAQEERFTRIKHDASFPSHAINYCLHEANCTLSDVDAIVFFEKPFLKFERILETYVAMAPRGLMSFKKSMPLWLRDKLFQKRLILKELQTIDSRAHYESKLFFSEHHLSHAASAFFPSPYKEAVILTLDGVGEWQTSTVATGYGNSICVKQEIQFPHSLGLLYSAFTYYLGFKVNSGEYKVMGLAPYGQAIYVDKIQDNIIDIKDDGSFHLDQRYFNYCTGLTMTSKAFNALFGAEPRKSETEPLTKFHMDIAASIQAVLEAVILKMTSYLHKRYGLDNLCLAGGVALNCVANGKIKKQGLFKNIWVQPAAGDAGGALGAALAFWHLERGEPRNINPQDAMKGAFLGPHYKSSKIQSELDRLGAVYHEKTRNQTLDDASTMLAEGLSVGWFSGRMEFGPRSLGARSILCDPRGKNTQRNLNLKIKFRESFRPFAPSILSEEVEHWFDYSGESPYMLMVADVLKQHRTVETRPPNEPAEVDDINLVRSTIPAVTHVNYSARVQTVDKDINPNYHGLISRFFEKTGCPMLVNTSFNVRGEPIVCTPCDAFNCFMGTELDVLVFDEFILIKKEQNPKLLRNYKHKFSLD